MKYYFNKMISGKSFEVVVEKTTEELKKEGFGVLTHIDMKATLKNKLDVDIERYEILGACNPPFAYKSLQVEDKIGLMLPCNVIVQQKGEEVEVSAVDPMVSMQGIENEALVDVAEEVQKKMKRIIESI